MVIAPPDANLFNHTENNVMSGISFQAQTLVTFHSRYHWAISLFVAGSMHHLIDEGCQEFICNNRMFIL